MNTNPTIMDERAEDYKSPSLDVDMHNEARADAEAGRGCLKVHTYKDGFTINWP